MNSQILSYSFPIGQFVRFKMQKEDAKFLRALVRRKQLLKQFFKRLFTMFQTRSKSFVAKRATINFVDSYEKVLWSQLINTIS